ncbi:MAG: hypothetical protein OXG04_04100 [Acidobacteria bacterium]|nr:hypothetical protein [Acidobacteriota bacterium]
MKASPPDIAQPHKRIQDFGEHIPGARKDLLGSDVVSTVLGGVLPQRLTEAWPAPPWEQLAAEHAATNRDPDELAFLRAVRDHLRTRHGWRNEHWLCRPGQDGGGLLRIALDVMQGDTRVWQELNRIQALASEWTWKTIAHLMVLYRHAGHARDLGTLRCFERDGQWKIGKPVTGRTGLYRTIISGRTIAEAAAKLPAALARLDSRAAEEKKTGSGPSPYSIRWIRERGETLPRYGVWRQHAGRWVRVYECAARGKQEAIAEARDRICDHRDELDAWFERWRTVPSARNSRDEPRTPAGEAGTDEPDEFTRRFAFRGVQFGNWVSAARRRADLTDTSQGFEDLAAIVGWPARALSLGGALGLAFGARGRGGPQRTRAHYEPALRVIAISKPAGPGALAHEWFHALDHEASRLCTRHRHGYATESWPDAERAGTPAGRLAKAMHAYGSLLKSLGLFTRSAKLDRRRPKAKPYWSTTRELAARAFEAWVRWRLAGMGIRNDYLVNIAPASRWTAPDEMELADPYPTRNEILAIDEALSEIADAGRGLVPQWLGDQHEDRPAGPSAATAASRPARPDPRRG